MTEKIKLGIVGSRRGSDFKSVCDALDNVSIHAVCDKNEEALLRSREALGANETYLDYYEMLDKAGLDAILISTPMALHVPQSIAALERDIHVLCEVPAAVCIDECKELVLACKKSEGIFMLAENYIYTKQNQIIKELVDRGLFGTPYYAEGEYIHQIKEYALKTPWRRHWQLGIDGITYGTHSLGPILQWMPGDRVVKVCCEGTGIRHQDTEGKPFAQASSTMLCKTEKEALIKIRVDLLSDRPHGPTNYQLQGTDGCYESSRGGQWDKSKIWLRELNDKFSWTALSSSDLTDKYMPDKWRNLSEAAQKTGHGGGDYFTMLDFINALRGESPPLIGIHEGMDMTLPGLLSQQSIQQDGAWFEVPDSRKW